MKTAGGGGDALVQLLHEVAGRVFGHAVLPIGLLRGWALALYTKIGDVLEETHD